MKGIFIKNITIPKDRDIILTLHPNGTCSCEDKRADSILYFNAEAFEVELPRKEVSLKND